MFLRGPGRREVWSCARKSWGAHGALTVPLWGDPALGSRVAVSLLAFTGAVLGMSGLCQGHPFLLAGDSVWSPLWGALQAVWSWAWKWLCPWWVRVAALGIAQHLWGHEPSCAPGLMLSQDSGFGPRARRKHIYAGSSREWLCGRGA